MVTQEEGFLGMVQGRFATQAMLSPLGTVVFQAFAELGSATHVFVCMGQLAGDGWGLGGQPCGWLGRSPFCFEGVVCESSGGA